jgi:hypothetical protein
LGIGFGSLVTYGSFNKYNNDCVRWVIMYTSYHSTYCVW